MRYSFAVALFLTAFVGASYGLPIKNTHDLGDEDLAPFKSRSVESACVDLGGLKSRSVEGACVDFNGL
jgi:hypothetical protein